MTEAGFIVQGWCPGALRPMASGDGLVVRVRPWGGRLTPEQAQGLAMASQRHGNGLIDLSARGNVQLRGVTEDSHPALMQALWALDLLDPDPVIEARRNILLTPFADAQGDALAQSLGEALRDEGPALPGKFGFVIDTGPQPVMADIAGDIRIERAADGGLILRCDGASLGARVGSDAQAVSGALALARWFVAAGGVHDGRGRMADLIARGARPDGALAATVAPADPAPEVMPGLVTQGALVGFAFGQLTAPMLAALAGLGPLRVTPWRMLLIEGLEALPDIPGLILRPDDPLRRVVACTGAPGCLQARGPVRPLAARLAATVPPGRLLHVSGCAKGCAHPGRADVVLVATGAGFDVLTQATAQGAPLRHSLPADSIDLKDLF